MRMVFFAGVPLDDDRGTHDVAIDPADVTGLTEYAPIRELKGAGLVQIYTKNDSYVVNGTVRTVAGRLGITLDL